MRDGRPGRVRVLLVLRSLPRMGRPPEADAAPGAHGGRAGVRRLRRSHHGGDRRGDRRNPPRRDLRRRAGRLQLHLCGSDLDAVAAGLDRRARGHAGVHRRCAQADRQRQSACRDHPGLLLRAVGQPHLRRHGVALRHRGRFRRVRTSRATRQRSRSASRSCSAGSWRGCATGGSSPWPS